MQIQANISPIPPDYFPFGMRMLQRSSNSSTYKYGFNGKEKDDELKGDGNSYDFGARIYDPRIVRFLSVDPWTDRYAWQTPFAYHRNSPIAFIDWNGFGDPVEIEGGGEVVVEEEKEDENQETWFGTVWVGPGGPTLADGKTPDESVEPNSLADAPGKPHDLEYTEAGLSGASGVFFNTNQKGIEADREFVDQELTVVNAYLFSITYGVEIIDPYKGEGDESISSNTAIRAATYAVIIDGGRRQKTMLKVVDDAYTATVNGVSEVYEGALDFFSDIGYKTNEAIYNVNNWGTP